MKEKTHKKRIFSGIQPTNNLTLGNYLGALKNWSLLQHDYDSLFCIVDLHSLTAIKAQESLLENTLLTAATYLASGIDAKLSTLFVQSHVKEHTELSWILTTIASMGELSRMTQFKSKTGDSGENAKAGLFCYPVLMAADILAYQTNLVPVGDDQRQHIELTRDLALRFNTLKKKDVFTIPDGFYPKLGARVMDLQNPESKMSKSAENPKGSLFLVDTDKQIMKKVKSAVTDSGTEVTPHYEKISAGLKNLFSIEAALTNRALEEVHHQYVGIQYGKVKESCGEVIISCLAPLRTKVEEYLNDKGELINILNIGAKKAQSLAQHTLGEVKKSLNLLP